MTETEKKELAEWMGWKNKPPMENGNWWIIKPKSGDGVTAHCYNPDIRPEQFLEVLDHMTEDERIAVEIWMLSNTSFCDIEITKISVITYILYYFKNKSEVIKALLQTINQ